MGFLCLFLLFCCCFFNLLDVSESEESVLALHLPIGPLKEENSLINDVFNTFYLRLFSFVHMIKDHSDSERGNPL